MAEVDRRCRLVPEERAQDYSSADVGHAFDAGAGRESIHSESMLRDFLGWTRFDCQHAQRRDWWFSEYDSDKTEFDRCISENGCMATGSVRLLWEARRSSRRVLRRGL